MALSKVAPLAWNAPIVDEHGNPTPYFQRQLAQLLNEKAATDALAEGAVPNTTQVIAGTGLSGGGALSADVTLNVDTTAEAERIRDVIGTALVAGTNITITVNDGGDTITINASGGSGGRPSGAMLYHNTTQSLPATTDTYLALNSSLYDDASYISGTAPGEITIPSGKTYCRVTAGGSIPNANLIIVRDTGSGFQQTYPGLGASGQSTVVPNFKSSVTAIIPCSAGHKFRVLARGSAGTVAVNLWMAIEAW